MSQADRNVAAFKGMNSRAALRNLLAGISPDVWQKSRDIQESWQRSMLRIPTANVKAHSDEEKPDKGLVESMKARGHYGPRLVVRPIAEGQYEILLGNRYFAAASAAALPEVKCFVREINDFEAAEWREAL